VYTKVIPFEFTFFYFNFKRFIPKYKSTFRDFKINYDLPTITWLILKVITWILNNVIEMSDCLKIRPRTWFISNNRPPIAQNMLYSCAFQKQRKTCEIRGEKVKIIINTVKQYSNWLNNIINQISIAMLLIINQVSVNASRCSEKKFKAMKNNIL